jgi:hypothetical protein
MMMMMMMMMTTIDWLIHLKTMGCSISVLGALNLNAR